MSKNFLRSLPSFDYIQYSGPHSTGRLYRLKENIEKRTCRSQEIQEQQESIIPNEQEVFNHKQDSLQDSLSKQTDTQDSIEIESSYNKNDSSGRPSPSYEQQSFVTEENDSSQDNVVQTSLEEENPHATFEQQPVVQDRDNSSQDTVIQSSIEQDDIEIESGRTLRSSKKNEKREHQSSIEPEVREESNISSDIMDDDIDSDDIETPTTSSKNTKSDINLKATPSSQPSQTRTSEESYSKLDARNLELIQYLSEVKSLYQKWSGKVKNNILDILKMESDSVIDIRIQEIKELDLDDQGKREAWLYADFLPFLDKVMDVISGLEWGFTNGTASYKESYNQFYHLLFERVHPFCVKHQWFQLENIKVGTNFNPRDHEGAGSSIVEEPYFNKIIHVKKIGLLSLSGVQRLRKAHVIVGN